MNNQNIPSNRTDLFVWAKNHAQAKVKFLIPKDDNTGSFDSVSVDFSKLLSETNAFDGVIREMISASDNISFFPIPLFRGQWNIPEDVRETVTFSDDNMTLVKFKREDTIEFEQKNGLKLNYSMAPNKILLNGQRLSLKDYLLKNYQKSDDDILCFYDMDITDDIARAFNHYVLQEIVFENCTSPENICAFFEYTLIPVNRVTIKNCGLTGAQAGRIFRWIDPYVIDHVDVSDNGIDTSSPEWKKVILDWECGANSPVVV